MRKISFAVLSALLCIGVVHSYANGTIAGSSSDPLISLSYINQEFKPQISKKGDELIKNTFDSLQQRIEPKLNDMESVSSDSSDVYNMVAALIKDKVPNSGSDLIPAIGYQNISLHNGDRINLGLGTKFVVTGGQTSLFGENPEFIDLSEGVDFDANRQPKLNTNYIKVSSGNGGIEASANYTSVSVCGSYKIIRAYTPQYENMADGLFNIGLFKGTNSGYELDRSASRIEALVMLIRLLGEENAALECTEQNPFSDVDAWAERYVAYAYAKGYTKGTSSDKFSPSLVTTADQYSTFVLRALGYSDSDGDFSWNNAANFSVEKGIITPDDKISVSSGTFRRDYMVLLSCRALFANLKSNNISLLDNLISNGTVDSKSAKASKNLLKNIPN